MGLCRKVHQIVPTWGLPDSPRSALYFERDMEQQSIIEWYLGNVDVSPMWTQFEVFNETEIDQIISICEKNFPQEEGEIYNPEFINSFRNSQLRWIHSEKETEWIYRRIVDAVNFVNAQNYYLPLLGIETLQYTIYDSNIDGAFYAKHQDVVRHNMSSEFRTRALSFSLQLTDPKEYEGGDLVIDNVEADSVASKKKGSMTFFLSDMGHEVKPVTSGIRKSLVGWVHRS